MSKCFINIAALIFSIFVIGQNKDRLFVSAEDKATYLEVKVSNGIYQIKPYSKNIIETTFIPFGETFNSTSHAVVLNPKEVSTTLEISDDQVSYATKNSSVLIQKQPFQISYYYKDKFLISEKNGYIKNDSLETIQFNLTKDEVLYGGGARALGMNRRGHRLQLYNRAHYGYETHSELMNFTMPIILSSQKYMVHFDNAPIGFLDLDSKSDNTLTYETISGRKTYQVIAEDSWYDLLDAYTDLTGKQPMPPRWALGNFSSRFGYHSQYETEATIKAFKDAEIPVDAIILDLYWFGKEVQGTMGNLEVDRDSFPDFEDMVGRLKQQGVKTILITEPFILTTSKRWQEAIEQEVLAKDSLGNPYTYDFYFGNTGLIDIYNPKAEQWFWNIYRDLANKGVAGVWGDLGEPEVHPSSLIHHTGTADEVHNIYGHDWARLVFEGYQRDFPEMRPFILMRAGYSGSQRYGLIPWSGDVNRTWGGLQSQPEIALQMGMQGLAYMHSDLGGFAGANLDDELYVRWLQYGVFQPIFRPHAQEDVPSEPVFRSEKAKALSKQAIELRYKLLPYNYNLMFENYKNGTPLMRPLFFEDENPELFNYSTSYLWGKDILVSPVLEAGKRTQDVYFPKDQLWFDFNSDTLYEGGKTHVVALNETTIPTFVRAGAFIPMAKPMQNTIGYNINNFDLHYYFHRSVDESEREFYNDDGLSAMAYENDAYEVLEFEAELKRNTLEIEFEAEVEENYSSATKQIQLIIHNIQKQPRRIKIDGKRVVVNWNESKNNLMVPVTWNPEQELEIIIKLKK
ncbi:glycoside hydrolase family 31 protein [Paucihalobacter sp.]|uniref:glycoside hydrolase family 31 protein n=1 Tax=Paucihalobacter sp. TaxID=2850405 RepID=UPI002FE28B7B